MFKKLILAVMAVFLSAGVVFASQVNSTIIDGVTLDDSPTLVTSDTIFVQDYKKVGFFVNYDETSPYTSVSGAVTTEYSYDGTNWITGYFNDFAGGSTLQTSETISSDGWYYLWIDPDLDIPFARVIVSGTNLTSQDTILLSTYLVGEK